MAWQAGEGFERHLARCNNVVLPGSRRVLRLGVEPVGFVEPALADDPLLRGLLVAGDDGSVTLRAAADLDRAASRLAEAGRIVVRHETFDVRASEDAPPVATLDRGALPDFGILAAGVHLNGLVEEAGRLSLWVARRAADKHLDPGKLDHLAAGGVPTGLTPRETLAKEAQEECGLGPEAIARAQEVGLIRYAMQRPEGLRRDVLHCYDLALPADWRPVALDGEVEAFELWPIERALATVRDTDDFKFNVNLVLIDLFIRRGLIEDPDRSLRRALAGGLGSA